ncbi:hypothetical protein ACFQY4_35450 [Catellatospora bangladeshensis]
MFAKIDLGEHRLCFCGVRQLQAQAPVQVELVLGFGLLQRHSDVAQLGD